MDTEYASARPEWRPKSSLSRASEKTSTIRSSRLLVPSMRTSSPASSDRSGLLTISSDAAQLGQEIAPWESTVCDRLVEGLRGLSTSKADTEAHEKQVANFNNLEEVLQHAAVTIRWHAKWFPEPALATLVKAAITAAATSTASTELSAAVNFIDTITVYSHLSPSSLPIVAKFLSQTYYAATRAYKTNRLAKTTWTALQHILDSHLGQQAVTTLLEIVSCGDDAVLDSRQGYRQFAGALMIISNELLLKSNLSSSLPPVTLTQLADSLWAAVMNGTDDLRETIMETLNVLIANDLFVQDLDDESSWDILLDTVEPCVTLSSESPAAGTLVETLVSRAAHFEYRNLPVLANLAIDFKVTLPSELSTAMLPLWEEVLPTRDVPNAFLRLLTKLCQASQYTSQLDALVERSVLEIFVRLPEDRQFTSFVQTIQDLSIDPATTDEAADILAAALVTMFRRSVRFAGRERTQRTLFQALCKMSRRCLAAAEALFRIRADADGAVYVESGLLSQTFPAHSEASSVAAVMHDGSSLPLQDWHDVIVAVIQGCVDWKIYIYFLSELPSLLGNHAMFDPRIEFIKSVSMSVTDLLDNGVYPEPPAETGLTKSHVTVALLRIMTAVLSYHRHLSRQEILGIVSPFLNIAGSRDHIVSTASIHALTICCYELPDLLANYMDDVIDKMSKLVTQRNLAIHVLLFLAGLSRQPKLFHNFQTHDFKKILGVCGSYLQSIRGTSALTDRQTEPYNDQSSRRSDGSTDALPQYVYALAHHVIAFWYLALKVSDRGVLKEFITSCLRYTSADGIEVVEDQGLVTIDLMDRVDATDLAAQAGYQFEEVDGRTIVTNRLTGLLIITTETALRTGKTIATIRRATGTESGLVVASPHDAQELRYITTTVDGGEQSSFLSIFPHDADGHTYGRIYVPSAESLLGTETTLTLPEDDSVSRAIQQFDRTSALDSHKAGIIYIGEGQSTEDEILQNVMGSPDYVEFVLDLGSLATVKGASFNTQGLDRIDDTDGQHTIVWRNDLTELLFHITTFMPNNDDDIKSNTASKKRHIGNDYVNIVFNNSGSPFDFNTFPSQFNFVYIVIAPAARTSFIQTRTQKTTTDKTDRFYAVQVLTRPGYPAISSAAEEKIISGASLPEYVRNLALNECILALMWAYRDEPGEYPSSWRSRLHQIRRLWERYGP